MYQAVECTLGAPGLTESSRLPTGSNGPVKRVGHKRFRCTYNTVRAGVHQVFLSQSS